MNKKLSNNNKRSKIKKAVNIFGNAGKMDVASAIGAASSGIASIIDTAKSNAEVNTTEADNIIESIESYKPATGSLDALADSYNNFNLNTIPNIPTIDSGKMLLNNAKAALSGASSGASMGGAWGALAGAGIGLIGSNIGTVRGIIKREEEESRINTAYNSAVKDARNKALASRDNILKDSTDKLMSELLAYGGPLFAYGGQTHGSDFTNGLMFINNGGTHESNPYEGVPISMDHEGTPNLVEEGEIIWNDYVFSNRLKVPKSIQKKYKLGKKEMTFANAIDKLSKESEERPNDPISTRGLEDILMHMAIEQETIKSKKQNKKVENNKFVEGGPTSGMSWFQNSNGNYYQEYLDAVNALTKQQYIDYIKRSTGRDVAYTDQEFNKIKAGMTDGNYGQGHIDMYNIMQSQPLKVSNANLEALIPSVKPLNTEEVKPEDTVVKPTTLGIPEINNYPTWMRYAPAIGHGALAITDALGLTNKPNYSNANSIIDASRKASIYDPIGFKPIGDYITYNPFDTEYHANQLRAISNATKKQIINNSKGIGAAAISGILASDNNTMNQLGNLYRKAAEYNLEQRQKVADFNRATNITNSEGFLKSGMANQSAAAQARALGLEGLMTGYKMKEQANLMSDQAKSANISGLLTSLGNIGYDNANRNMMNWGIASGTWAPSQWKYDPLTGKPVNQNG